MKISQKDVLSPDVLSLRMFIFYLYVSRRFLSLRTFCPYGCLVFRPFLSRWKFFSFWTSSYPQLCFMCTSAVNSYAPNMAKVRAKTARAHILQHYTTQALRHHIHSGFLAALFIPKMLPIYEISTLKVVSSEN